jgi:GlpG protein
MQSRIAPQFTTITLCALCVLITLAHTTSTVQDGTLWSRIGYFTAVSSMDIWDGARYPLFTDMFLHSNFMQGMGITHLLFDVYWLYLLGCLVELSIGPVWYIGFIVASAIVGSCVELAVSGEIGIGASGVVYALFGLMWAGRFRYPEWQMLANPYNMRLMIAWGVFCIFTTYIHLMSIANGAHFGGLIFGYSVGMVFFGQRRRWLWTLPIAGVIAACVLGLTYVPWSSDWLWWKADKAFDKKDYPQAIALYRSSIDHGAPADDAWKNIAAAWHNQGIIDDQRGDAAAIERGEQEEAAANKKSADSGQ